MSDSLAIEWGDEQLVLLQGKVSGKHVSAKRAAVLNWPEGIDPIKDSERASEWLKGELTSRGFNGKAIVSLPREGVVVRHLELPNIPDDELPGMVKLQAATKVTQAADKYLLDYVPLPPRGSDTRDVLMTTVPTEVTGTITKILSAAGIELGSVGVSSFHSAELVLHQQDNKTRAANQLHLSVTLAGSRIELALLRGKCALATSSTRFDGDGDALQKAVNAEINRLRLSAQNLHGGLPISYVWVTPSDPRADSLCAFLKGKLNCEGSCLDPLGGTGDIAEADRGYFTATAGHLFAEHSSLGECVNYLSPRKAVAKRDDRKVRLIMLAVGAALLLGVGYWLFQRNLAQRAADTQLVQDKIDAIKTKVSQGKDDLESAAEVDEWALRQSDWLAEMAKLQGLMPGGESLLVEKFNFRPGRQNNRAAIQIDGVARNRQQVDDLTNLLQLRGYQASPPNFQDSSRDEDYPLEFSFVAKVPLDES